MKEQQVERRMTEAWELFYLQYDEEAEWYGINSDCIWVCDIPSRHVTVKMELDEKGKCVVIYEAPVEKQTDYRYVRETDWHVAGYYGW